MWNNIVIKVSEVYEMMQHEYIIILVMWKNLRYPYMTWTATMSCYVLMEFRVVRLELHCCLLELTRMDHSCK